MSMAMFMSGQVAVILKIITRVAIDIVMVQYLKSFVAAAGATLLSTPVPLAEATTGLAVVSIAAVFVSPKQNIARIFSSDTKKCAFFCSLPLALMCKIF